MLDTQTYPRKPVPKIQEPALRDVALERLLDLYDVEGFDDVANLDIVEVLDTDAAFHTGLDFLGLVLAPLERRHFAGVDHDAVADEAYLALGEFAVAHQAAGNGAHLGNLEGLLDLGGSGNLFLLFGLEHTLQTVLDLVDGIVNNRV